MTADEIAELLRPLSDLELTNDQFCHWTEIAKAQEAIALALASRALPAAPDVPVTGTSVRLMEQAEQRSDAYIESIRDQAKREAYEKCKAIPATYERTPYPMPEKLDEDSYRWGLSCGKDIALEDICDAIEALAEKKT